MRLHQVTGVDAADRDLPGPEGQQRDGADGGQALEHGIERAPEATDLDASQAQLVGGAEQAVDLEVGCARGS